MRKKFDILITKTARLDIEDIYNYISQDSIENAAKFINEIEKKIYSLQPLPERNPTIPENEYFGTSYRHLSFGNYRIIYRISEKNIFVLRIFHSKRLLSEESFD